MPEARENKIKQINMFLELYNDEALNTIELLLETYAQPIVSKGDIMKLSLTATENNKCDSALPFDYVKRIQEVLPNFSTMSYVYDYSNNTFGEMRNIFESMHKHLHTKLNASNFIKTTQDEK